MTKDEIIEMAKQAGIGWGERLGGMPEFLERFAKLVAQHERDRMCEQCKWRNHENTTHNETN
jgi:hypothetical protein